MRWRICSIGKTDILIHPSLLAFLGYAGITGHMWMSVIALGSIILHEAAHALTSALLDQAPRCLEVTPLGALMRLEDESGCPPVRRLLVLLAGPAMSFLLCWIAFICTRNGWIDAATGRLIFTANIAILMVNLLPVLPLDGGRLMVLVLESFLPERIVYRIIRWFGTSVGILLIVLNILCCWKLGGWNFSLTLTGCCVIYCAASATTTWAMAELRYFMDRKIRLEKAEVLPASVQVCLHKTPLIRLIRMLPPKQHALYICHEAGSMRYLGCIDESRMIQHYLCKPQDHAIDCISSLEKAEMG